MEYVVDPEDTDDVERCLRKFQHLRLVEIPYDTWPIDMAQFVILQCSPNLRVMKFSDLPPTTDIELLIDWSPVEKITVWQKNNDDDELPTEKEDWNQWVESIRGLVQERWPRVGFYRRGTNYARIVIARKDKPDISGKPLFHRDVSTVIAMTF